MWDGCSTRPRPGGPPLRGGGRVENPSHMEKTTMNDVRVLIADDEPLARRTLREHLSDVGWIKEIHEVGDGLSTIRAVDSLQPDLLFLDIRMPGASGIAVAEQISHRPYIVFTTAFDRYAVTAFEPRDGSRLTIVVASGARIPASRTGSAQIRLAGCSR